MKTIEERAKAFCENNICVDCGDRKNCDRGCVGCCIPTFSALEWLIQFGKSEHTGLTRWHDPKEELPEKYKDVEIKTDKGKVSVCNMDLDERGRRYWYVSRTDYMIPDANIIGWREIHE